MTMTFSRTISNQEKVFENLRKHPLFILLKKDILNGVVFPAIRNEIIDFYYGGQRLFNYRCKSNVFSTNIKFASVYDFKGDYISEKGLKSLKPIDQFGTPDTYKRIKENCSVFSGVETSGVSKVYSKWSILNEKNKSDICILDIEISFEKEDIGRDQIDLLVYNKKEKKLRFYEAKHFLNKELWSSKGEQKVLGQLKRYNNQLHKKDDIRNVYQGYVRTINNLFGTNFPEPVELDNKVVLFVFGFDQAQKDGKLKANFEGGMGFKDILYYSKGNINIVSMNNVWNNIKTGK